MGEYASNIFFGNFFLIRFILLTNATRLLVKANKVVLNALVTLQNDYLDSKATKVIPEQIKISYFVLKAIKNIFLRYSRLRRMVKVVSSAERYTMDAKKTKVME